MVTSNNVHSKPSGLDSVFVNVIVAVSSSVLMVVNDSWDDVDAVRDAPDQSDPTPAMSVHE